MFGWLTSARWGVHSTGRRAGPVAGPVAAGFSLRGLVPTAPTRLLTKFHALIVPFILCLLFLLSPLLACAKSEQSPSRPESTSPSRDLQPRQDFGIPGRILFVKDGTLVVWSNGSTKRLTDQRVAFDTPAWSPDGKRIAAALTGQNHSDLVILTSAGVQEKQLTKNLSNVRVQDSTWARHPTWSQDGKKIAYVSDKGTFRLNLWMINADGSAAQRVYVPAVGDGDLDSPTWSPDGKRIAFTAFWDNVPQVYVYTLAGNTAKKISSFKEGAYDPAWSPDGRWIAFSARSEGKNDLWVADPDGKSSGRATNLGTARAAMWSQDSQLLAFVAAQNQIFDLFVAKVIPRSDNSPIVASEPKQLTRGESIDATSGLSWVN
ncbi:MAG: PD40 domain-containing protein [Chloroflexi bacterium]|nr:PD40 domain-containing protein [Chloroflexota bacterium]